MKINENFLLREVAGTPIVMPVGEAAEKLNGMIKLNETGIFLWKKLEVGTTEEELLDALCAEYAVDRATAAGDIARFVSTLRAAGILCD